MTRLPFTTDDVREQCAHFGDAPLAHPLPVRHLLMMCDRIDELETALADAQPKYRDDWLAMKRRAEAAEVRHEVDVRYIAKIEARMERAEAINANVREYADRLVPGHMQTSLYVALEG